MYWSRKIFKSDWEVRVKEANGTMEAIVLRGQGRVRINLYSTVGLG